MIKFNKLEEWQKKVSVYNFFINNEAELYFTSIATEKYKKAIDIIKIAFSRGIYNLTLDHKEDISLLNTCNEIWCDINNIKFFNLEAFILKDNSNFNQDLRSTVKLLEDTNILTSFEELDFQSSVVLENVTFKAFALRFLNKYIFVDSYSNKLKAINGMISFIANRNNKTNYDIIENVNKKFISIFFLNLLKIISDGIISNNNNARHLDFMQSISFIYDLEVIILKEINFIIDIYNKVKNNEILTFIELNRTDNLQTNYEAFFDSLELSGRYESEFLENIKL